MKIKTWFFNKKNDEAKAYHMYLDYTCEDGKCLADSPETVTIIGSVIKESDKAVYFWANTGSFGGSTNGFKMWIPKSVIC